jgi:uncharacterized protein (TIGR04255 family)
MKKWEILNNPPIAVALFQLKYSIRDRKLSDFLAYDALLRHHFPIRKDNIQVGINLDGSIPLGMSKITGTTDAKIGTYIYLSTDQKSKLEISEDTVTFIDEHPYQGWEYFKETTKFYLSIISDVLNNCEVIRTSIRFINRFTFDNFDNPQEYFKTLISGTEDSQLPYPLRQYGFRLFMDVPDTDTYSIVNQNIENARTNTYIYTFDIDVLDRQHLVFDINTVSENMENLRNIKNEIFFSNVTQKTLDLCN